MIRPQQKQQKQLMDMRNAIKVGDEVITIGGVKGTIVSVTDDSVILETSSQKLDLNLLEMQLLQMLKHQK